MHWFVSLPVELACCHGKWVLLHRPQHPSGASSRVYEQSLCDTSYWQHWFTYMFTGPLNGSRCSSILPKDVLDGPWLGTNFSALFLHYGYCTTINFCARAWAWCTSPSLQLLWCVQQFLVLGTSTCLVHHPFMMILHNLSEVSENRSCSIKNSRN